jgi:predicted transcriptional regulator
MSKEAVFTMKLEPDLRDQFMAAAQALQRPASQVLRELMRGFVQDQQHSSDYETYLNAKVNASRSSLQAGLGVDNAAVESQFAARRAAVAA